MIRYQINITSSPTDEEVKHPDQLFLTEKDAQEWIENNLTPDVVYAIAEVEISKK